MPAATTRNKLLDTILLAAICLGLALACADDGDITAPGAPASLTELFGNDLFRANGSRVGTEALEHKAIIGIYFSAQWCPACGTFTPMLVDFANSMSQAARSFEVVLVSSDHGSQEMYAFMRDYKMPWLAVPHDGERALALTKRYGVRFIPTLVVIDQLGRTITLTGREDVVTKGAAAYDAWLAQRSTGRR